MTLTVDDVVYEGKGTTKKKAKLMAAEVALQALHPKIAEEQAAKAAQETTEVRPCSNYLAGLSVDFSCEWTRIGIDK